MVKENIDEEKISQEHWDKTWQAEGLWQRFIAQSFQILGAE